MDTFKRVLTTEIEYMLHGLNKTDLKGPEKKQMFIVEDGLLAVDE